mgnify:CR=1 FL=1
MARKLLGEILREEGKVTEEQIREALQRQLRCEKALGRILFDMGLVSEVDVSHAWARQIGAEVVNLDGINVPPELIRKLPKHVAQKYNVLPIKAEGGMLTLAMSDPLDDSALGEIAGFFGLRIKPVVSSALKIAQAIENCYR